MSETKTKILQTAIKEWGKDITSSLDDIAKQSGVSRRTLHRHYKGKEDLMVSVFSYIIEAYLVQTKLIIKDTPNLKERLKKFLNFDIESGSTYMMFCQLRKTSYKEMATEDANLKELYSIYMGLFQQLKEENQIREELSSQWLEVFYSTIIESALRSIEMGMTKEDSLVMAWSSFWNGIKTS